MTSQYGSVSASEVADIQGLLVMVGLASLVVLLVACVRTATRRRVLDALAGTATVFAAGIALLATAGSLWYSESAGFPPCELCWYQRIAMYPLVIVLGIAAFRRSSTGRITGLVIAVLGLAVSIWHNTIETFPSMDSGGCDPTNPCTIRWVEGMGFWTIPRLAAACFVAIIILTTIDHVATRDHKEQTP